EDRIYKMWEEANAFKADASSDKESFTVSMPPPNATGQLHLGHAVMLALEDIFVRFARMQGKEALWLPGTDHAAIATESVVIKKIQEEEKIADPRAALGREELLKRIAHFVDNSQDTIRSQVRKMGASCDWSRERYTMDASLSRCVNEVFVKMYKDGLIYRGHRIVNWDPKMKTTVSDDEMEYKDEKSPFYTFKYGPFEIGTARPETKFGDKYVVMHPDDKRYTKYKHGDQFECEWINGKITATVIKDKAIDPVFGTGCMTITPWHSHVDFEIAERHELDKEQIIDFEGNLLPVAKEFAGMGIEEAREKIVKKLDKKGLLLKVDEDYEHRVAVSYRGKGKVEPQIKEQWFVDVNKEVISWPAGSKKHMSLKEVMQSVIRNGDIKIIPDRFEKTYFHWIDNLRDWCVSRQIWWGHRVPVWYKEGSASSDMHVGVEPPEGDKWIQDPDTLDTWFSSGLWTWSTLIDPKLTGDNSLSLEDLLEKSPDFQKFHPTSVMETGYDILFFWVARMILMTTYATGQIPFDTVYLHGLIRTRDGKKMSKSDPSTCIDPLEVIPQFGADALRMSMIVGQSPGNDFRLYEEKIAGYRNFVNKLWNAGRFVLMKCESGGVNPGSLEAISGKRLVISKMNLVDRALMSELQKLVEDVTEGMENYKLSEVGERIYSFVWDYFCDWYLELSKENANPEVMVYAMRMILKLLHPYCPFVTEELWASFKHGDDVPLIQAEWPKADEKLKDEKAASDLQIMIDVISAIRRIRSEHSIESGKKVNVIFVTKNSEELLGELSEEIKRLAKVDNIKAQSSKYEGENTASAFTKHVEVHVPLEGLIDAEKEKEKLTKEKEQLEKFLKGVQAKLGNAKFVENAASDVVEKEKQKEKDAIQKIEKINGKLEIS
ncbi:valine--tRNA ligase, partial [Candidatus Peribacteria bacterium]|nr:valine--tRNA ligase [Candidatus Peribacteria bacterium]